VGNLKNIKRKQSRVTKYRVSGCILKTWSIRENKERMNAGERQSRNRRRV
jgi:hypothetical protein